jgi:site-specific recombinase XerD
VAILSSHCRPTHDPTDFPFPTRRHACATRLLAEGLSLKEIGDHLGHHSKSATSMYAKVNIAALREVAAFDLGDAL